MNDRDFDPMLDCYRSWEAYIALCRDRLEAMGEYPSVGPWQNREPSNLEGARWRVENLNQRT